MEHDRNRTVREQPRSVRRGLYGVAVIATGAVAALYVGDLNPNNLGDPNPYEYTTRDSDSNTYNRPDTSANTGQITDVPNFDVPTVSIENQ